MRFYEISFSFNFVFLINALFISTFLHFILEPIANYVTSVVDIALKIHENEEPGDILAFLTGLDEVDQAVSLLSEHAKLIKEGKRE